MLKVLTAEQMREVDRLTTERYGLPSITLMENAAQAVSCVISEKLGGSVKGKSILILCGPGNNGGDGAALARLLTESGAAAYAIVFGDISRAPVDARTNFQRVQEIGSAGQIVFANPKDFADWESIRSRYFNESDPDVVVDALFGTGLRRPLEGLFREAASFAGTFCVDGVERSTRVISIDIPSGLDADRLEFLEGTVVRAHATVTFTAPKPANILPPASDRNGEVVVADIGSPPELIDEQPSQLLLATARDAKDWLGKTEFTKASYKNKRGHALIIAGSKNYTGAAVLCGDAAIRSGCGLATIAAPESSRESIVARVSSEVMVRGVSETSQGAVSEKAIDEVNEFAHNIDVIAIGSGLSSQEDETRRFVRRIVEERSTPILIDADGLTALSPFDISGSEELPLVLTPHEGEFRNLLGLPKEEFAEVVKDRVGSVRDFATRHKVFLVLKGERTLIGDPDGRVVVNPTGNSGLGKAGNGDTLTGILAGFLAQAAQFGVDILDTIVAGVYIAGMAGDVAEGKFGKRVMTASDVRECLVDVFEELSK